MQPRHLDGRQRNAERERYRCGKPQRGSLAHGVRHPTGGEPAEYCQRRQHENKVSNAVVHRRPQRDGCCKRQQNRQCDQKKNGSSLVSKVSARRHDQRTRGPPNPQSQKYFAES